MAGTITKSDVTAVMTHALIRYIDTLGTTGRSHDGIKARARFAEVAEMAALFHLAPTPTAFELDVIAYVREHPDWQGRNGARISREWLATAGAELKTHRQGVLTMDVYTVEYYEDGERRALAHWDDDGKPVTTTWADPDTAEAVAHEMGEVRGITHIVTPHDKEN